MKYFYTEITKYGQLNVVCQNNKEQTIDLVRVSDVKELKMVIRRRLKHVGFNKNTS